MAELPAFVQFPPSDLRTQITPEEWDQCLDAWVVLSESVLALSDEEFGCFTRNDQHGVIPFVSSYVHEHNATEEHGLLETANSLHLHKTVYLLCHRLLSLQNVNESLLGWKFLCELCQVFGQTPSLPNLLSIVWDLHGAILRPQLELVKRDLIQEIDKNIYWLSNIKLLSHLIRFSSEVGQFFAVGSDLTDSLIQVYPTTNPESKKSIVVFMYFMLLSLLKGKPNHSLLSNHLYTLKIDAQRESSENTSLVSTLVSETDFLNQLGMHTNSESDAPHDLEAGLLEFQVKRPRRQKGKGRLKDSTADDDVHIHQMKLITQIQDLFPELGSGFVAKLLDYYDEDVAKVTEHLLEDSIPPTLASQNRSEQLTSQTTGEPTVTSRHNIHDDDDFDNLSVSTAKLHIGKAEYEDTPTNIKAHIYAALEAFDADEDERDDTYDDADHVGGSIDATSGDLTAETSAGDEVVEGILFGVWKTNPADLTRSARFTTRRKELKTSTGWTDEAIEGFATMMGRDPNREKNFQRRFADREWQGQQSVLERTSWRDEGSVVEQGDGNSNRGRGSGGFRGRGRGTLQSSGPADSERARKNKEVRGNQKRREGRARKTRSAMN